MTENLSSDTNFIQSFESFIILYFGLLGFFVSFYVYWSLIACINGALRLINNYWGHDLLSAWCGVKIKNMRDFAWTDKLTCMLIFDYLNLEFQSLI